MVRLVFTLNNLWNINYYLENVCRSILSVVNGVDVADNSEY